jgi:SAM-dependent methyltransferase
VKAFLDCGAFAVGIDLEPGDGREYVLKGDFHRTVFPDQSVDHVFTNSLDHAFDLDFVLAEVARVLKTDGRFVVEVALGLTEARATGDEHELAAGDFESCFWQTRDCAIGQVQKVGFRQCFAIDIDVPFQGTHYVFDFQSPQRT